MQGKTLETPEVALANREKSEEVGEERLAQDKVRVERESGSTRQGCPCFQEYGPRRAVGSEAQTWAGRHGERLGGSGTGLSLSRALSARNRTTGLPAYCYYQLITS